MQYYHAIKQEIFWKHQEQKRKSGVPMGTSAGFVSDPTQNEAIKNLTPVKYVTIFKGTTEYIVKSPEEWIECIDKVMNGMDVQDRNLVIIAFWKSHSWRSATMELAMDKDTFYRRRDKIISLFAIEAASRGLIKL